MQKRKFIKEFLRSVSLGAIAPSELSSILFAINGASSDAVAAPDEKKPVGKPRPVDGRSTSSRRGESVIVIGAGIAGLAAANSLVREGYSVTVLESQSSVGGRLQTDRSLGVPFDRGASWIHGPNGNPLTTLASRAGAKTFETDDDNVVVYDLDGRAYSDDRISSAEDLYNDVLDRISDLGDIDDSFLDVFRKNYPGYLNDRLWKYMLSAFLEFNSGGDISKLSSLYFDDDENFSGDDVIITNGYDTIAKFLAKGILIVNNSRVVEVNYSDSEALVTVAGGAAYRASYVVVTVPLGVLKNNIIRFTPGLPLSKVKAVSRMGMGNVNKFLLMWDEVFWDDELQYIGVTPDSRGKFNYFLNVNKFSQSSKSLMTFAFGDYADVTERMSDRLVLDAIMGNLRAIYGNEIHNPRAMLRTSWRSDINSFGAYSFAANG